MFAYLACRRYCSTAKSISGGQSVLRSIENTYRCTICVKFDEAREVWTRYDEVSVLSFSGVRFSVHLLANSFEQCLVAKSEFKLRPLRRFLVFLTSR